MQKGSKDYLDILSGQEAKHIQGLAIGIKSQTLQYLESIDLIKNDRTLRISDDRCERAKDHISTASKILLAYDSHHMPVKMDTRQQRRALEMIQEVLDGKREAVMFQTNKEGTKVKEMFSREIL